MDEVPAPLTEGGLGGEGGGALWYTRGGYRIQGPQLHIQCKYDMKWAISQS